MFLLVISFLTLSYQTGGVASQPGAVSASQPVAVAHSQAQEATKISVDQLTASNAVASLAETVNLPAAGDLREATATLSIKKELAQGDAEVISKPQIIQPEVTAQRGIRSHVAQQGESLETIAKRYKLSTQTLRWANNMTSDAVEVGRTILVPSVDGVLYTVKDGDTVQKLAEKYKASTERIVLTNDLTGADQALAKDSRLLIPGGELPENERPGYVAPRTYTRGGARGYTGGYAYGSMGGSIISVQYGYRGPTAGNRYAAGNCTWYAFERRAELGRHIGGLWGNATSWANSARAHGFVVNKTPAPGAIIQTSAGGGGYGHVGIVERIEGDQMIISDMNYAGYNKVTWRKIPLSQAGSFNYIH
ncbi:MAG: LysM peptidoglycan-binding domain-containing protein [Candidatus Saccharibacteria bacterium]|nr:LysM peptidoglycan-binding domain-containing protein [Candidatus Saccharibacteria bacterium]